MVELIDVGRQRDSIHQPSPPHLQDDRACCVVCQDQPHDDGSDFCTPCRTDLMGGDA